MGRPKQLPSPNSEVPNDEQPSQLETPGPATPDELLLGASWVEMLIDRLDPIQVRANCKIKDIDDDLS